MGIRPQRIFAMATGLAMVVVTIAALYLGTRANFDPTSGPSRLIYAFEAVIIGGLGSLWGTLAGGIILGVAQTVGAAINPEWQILAGPSRVPCRSPVQAARPFPARGRLRCVDDHGHSILHGRDSAPGHRRLTAIAVIALLLLAFAAPFVRFARCHPGPVLHPDHAGACAELEPAGGLCRPDLGRPAGFRRLWRLCHVRRASACSASIRSPRS